MARKGLTVIVLSNVPKSLKGYTSAYFVETSPGMFVGRVTARVRELLWEKIIATKKLGAATMVHTDDSEQGFTIVTNMSRYESVDFDGVTLVEHHPFNRSTRLGNRRLEDDREFLLNLEN